MGLVSYRIVGTFSTRLARSSGELAKGRQNLQRLTCAKLGAGPSRFCLPLSQKHQQCSKKAYLFAGSGDGDKLKRGFTLLETLIAIAFVTAALIGPVSLAVRGLLDVSFAKNKLIALNLAQEGIEFIRLTRENNVLCDSLDGGGINGSWKWNHDPGQGAGNVLDPSPEGVVTDLEADVLDLANDNCGPSNLDSPDFRDITGGGGPGLLQIDGNGFYNLNSGTPTVFRRKITVDTRNIGSSPDKMEIISEVTWQDRGVNRNVVLRDVLYNWK